MLAHFRTMAAVLLALAIPTSSGLVGHFLPADDDADSAGRTMENQVPSPGAGQGEPGSAHSGPGSDHLQLSADPIDVLALAGQPVNLQKLAAAQAALLRGVPVPDWPYDAVHLSWSLGDVNNDGADDILWETYCVDIDGCTQTGVPVANIALQDVCYPHEHHIQVLGGRSGDTLWDRRLDAPHPDLPYLPLLGGIGGCVVDSVLGVLDGDILLYTWQATQVTSSAMQIEHMVRRIDGAAGTEQWRWTASGQSISTFAGTTADAVLAIPIVQSPPSQGLDLLGGMFPGLSVRAIGFTVAGGGPAQASVQTYQPQEWAAGIDLETGDEMWRTDTIGPEPSRRVIPSSFEASQPFVAPLQGDSALIGHVIEHFMGIGCCYDLSGDGVPDLLLGTLETPITNPPVPDMDQRSGRLFLFDGADGSLLWDLDVEPGATSYCGLQVLPLTDVDGDGAHDFVARAFHGGNVCPADTPFTVSTVYSGKDGTVLWTHDTRNLDQTMVLIPLGDVQGDGANDLLRLLVDNAEPGQVGVTVYQEISVGAVDGATGDVLWEGASFAAAIDLALGLASLVGNGLPDSNEDGIADVWLDRLEFLEDQTAVHHLTLVSGRDGKTVHRVPTVGAFAIPIGLRDVTGDGREDHAILQGDADDIWITTYDGESGQTEWSRRVMSLNATNALVNIPLIKMHSVRLGEQQSWDALLGLTFFTIDLGGGRGPGVMLTQQHLSLAGSEGNLLWGIPTVGEGDASLIRKKPTPAVQEYEDFVDEQEALQKAEKQVPEGPAWAVPALAAGLGLAAAAGTVILLTRRKG